MNECPYCEEDISEHVFKSWARDYWTMADDFECPHCHRELEIEVEMCPEFIIRKPKVSMETILQGGDNTHEI